MSWGLRTDGPVQAIATDPATDLRMLHLVAAQTFGAELLAGLKIIVLSLFNGQLSLNGTVSGTD